MSGATDRFALRELSDHRIDEWFEEKVSEYRCPMELGDDTKALRGIHARGLGTIRGSLTLASSELPTGLPSDLPRFGILPTQVIPSRSFCAIQPAAARDSRRCPTAMKSRPSALASDTHRD